MDDVTIRKKGPLTTDGDDAGTRVWQRLSDPEIATGRLEKIERLATGEIETLAVDPMQEMRALIRGIRKAPRELDARKKLRAHAAEHGLWEQLALLLADEAHVQAGNDVLAAFYEELAEVHENLDQPIETIAAMEAVVALQPRELAHHDRLAWLYRRAGAWQKAAESFEKVAQLATDDRARAALRAAGKLYRDNGRLDRAAEIYRAIVARKPTDVDAWKALDELLAELKRWRELVDVRAARAELATGIDKAALLRAQARALEQAGEPAAAAEIVALAARHAPEDVSGLVDYADVLAREGKKTEAADVLAARIETAPPDQVAALRLRVAEMLDDPYARIDQWLAIEDGPHRAHALLLAGRTLLELGEHRHAARTLEQASERAPEDDDIRAALDEARTASAIARANDELAAGDRATAERRLRHILVSRPFDVAANLALADALDVEGAAAHLEEVVGEMPDDLPPEQAARLVHRLARAVAMRGDGDHAHLLLHEAHRLARRDLTITLALGESCFQRKLWREAAIHLGSLADHPDAAAHAAAVAGGLVYAARAEIRALRPANAEKHYLAAVKLDTRCAKAWHALAELAMERDDMVRATECLEHEAAVTTDARDRLRLYDALGDLAEGVLGDVARAERYWREAATTAEVPEVYEKLLRVQRRRGAAAERGETCERLAELAPERRKDLLEEAAQAYAAGADPRALGAAEKLMAAHGTDVDAVACASAVPGDPVRIAQWLKRALAAWDKAGDRGDGDPRRAELWRRLGDAERSRGDEAAALRAYQRAVATSPDSDGALAARRGLVDLAASHGRNAHTSRIALVEAHQDVDDVLAWARELAASGNADDARAAFELAGALGATFTDAPPPPRPMASDEVYGTVLDDTERRALVDDEDEGPLAEILGLLAEAAPMLCPDARTALIDAGFSDARRVSAASDAATVAMLPKIAKALGGPATLLHVSARTSVDLALVLGAPPLVVIGPRLASVRARTEPSHDRIDLELRFRLGRIVELARPHRVFAMSPAFDRLVAGLTDRDAEEAARLRSALPLVMRKKLADKVAGANLDPEAYRAACERAADRAGLLACGDVWLAIELAGGAEAARHLVKLAATQRYLAARKKLRPRR